MKLISVEKMKELESAANADGYSYEKMMLKAGENMARVVHDRFFSREMNHATGLVGGGNNGGDTLIALITLQTLGWNCSAVMIKSEDLMQSLVDELQSRGGKILSIEKLTEELHESHLILDGLSGTGFRGPMRPPYSDVLRKVAEEADDRIIVAVDCPSGVDCTTGDVCPETLEADLTVCMEAVKEGMVKFPAYPFCGELATVDLGIPKKILKEYESGDSIIDRVFVAANLIQRGAESHKGTFGHLIVCGGCVNYAGAPSLSARAAYRVGTGLVECAIPERIYEAVAVNNLESIFTLLDDEDGVIAEQAAPTLAMKLEAASCLLLGPGIGREETTLRFLQRLLFETGGKKTAAGAGFVPGSTKTTFRRAEKFPPLVIDADALRLLSKTKEWWCQLPARAVLTPHPGEMSALTGLPIDEIQKDRFAVARRFAREWNQVIVLKGALTLVALPEGPLAVLPFANSALAKAGTGDVLAGIIAGLIAQGMEPFTAAQAGAYIHAGAATAVVRRHGGEASLLAGDLVDLLPEIMSGLN